MEDVIPMHRGHFAIWYHKAVPTEVLSVGGKNGIAYLTRQLLPKGVVEFTVVGATSGHPLADRVGKKTAGALCLNPDKKVDAHNKGYSLTIARYLSVHVPKNPPSVSKTTPNEPPQPSWVAHRSST